MINELEFPGDTVYSSPHRRAIETLCEMLQTHPQKEKLKIVVLPLAKEVMSNNFGSVPKFLPDLKKELEEMREKFGFK